MKLAKLDPILGRALRAQRAPRGAYTVFIAFGAPPTDEQWAVLERHGVRRRPGARRLVTAMLSGGDIASLSDEPWVESIQLSQQLRPVEAV